MIPQGRLMPVPRFPVAKGDGTARRGGENHYPCGPRCPWLWGQSPVACQGWCSPRSACSCCPHCGHGCRRGIRVCLGWKGHWGTPMHPGSPHIPINPHWSSCRRAFPVAGRACGRDWSTGPCAIPLQPCSGQRCSACCPRPWASPVPPQLPLAPTVPRPLLPRWR